MSIDNKYYTVGITGHRDLLQSEILYYKEQIKSYLSELSKNMDKSLLLISPLADGADRLFIEAGKELGLEYEVILPMPIELYAKDFDESSLVEFNSLLIHAKKYSSIDIINNRSAEDIKEYCPARDEQYFAIGKYLAQECDVLVALWDGEDNKKVGGTADVVKYRKNLGKDIFHIVCKREGNV